MEKCGIPWYARIGGCNRYHKLNRESSGSVIRLAIEERTLVQ
jgi:hypothetical protein